MKQYTEEEFDCAKRNDKLKFKCEKCENIFEKPKHYIQSSIIKNSKLAIKYCSHKCYLDSREKKKTVMCINCNNLFEKKQYHINKTPNHFCSKSCAGTYNNTHKTTGNRRSKLEKYIEIELIKSYPDLEIHFNCKDAINSELDIYIPLLKLAFELNGLFHYEPIFGEDKLNQITNNDNRKFQACLERGIELCIIDSSGQKYFKKETSQIISKYYL